MKLQGKRKRGRPKRRWLDKVTDDIKEKGLSADDVYDRATWRHICHRTFHYYTAHHQQADDFGRWGAHMLRVLYVVGPKIGNDVK